MRRDRRSAPAWIRDSSKRSSIIRVSRSTSRRICVWYWDTSRGSITTWSSRASAMARSPASGVRRSWLTQATSSRRLASRARSRDRALARRSCAAASPSESSASSAGSGQRRGDVDAAVADVLHGRGNRPAGPDEAPRDEQRDDQRGQAGDRHQVQDDVAVRRAAQHAVGDDAHAGHRAEHRDGHDHDRTIRPIDRAASRCSSKIPMSAMISAMTSRRLGDVEMSDHWMPAGSARLPPAIAVTPPPARTGTRRPTR